MRLPSMCGHKGPSKRQKDISRVGELLGSPAPGTLKGPVPTNLEAERSS